MANPDGELTVAQRLGRALDRGLLPAGGPAEAAERLIERLERPARIALLGLPGSGKSSILNLLVGAVVVPETLRLPTIIVQHGNDARMICTLTDGTTTILPGQDLADVLPLAPALVTLEIDLPALKVISLLEVSAGPMEAEQKRAATWASKRSDIVIWCSTSYLPKEQAVWESLPDSVKDNSFMFLTKIDLLGSRDSATAMHDRVELRAGEEFRQILSITAKQARMAMPPGGAVNRDLFRDSGASAVIAAIKTRVQSGRRADMDTAELLLARHVEASELVARRFAEPGEEPETAKAWAPPPEPEKQVMAAEPVPTPATGDAAESEAGPDADDTAPDPVIEEADDPIADETAVEAELEEPPAEPLAEEAAAPEPETPVPSPAAAEPDGNATRSKRFADRIKRVANTGDPAAPPMVPLKTTWKSKTEAEAPPEPEPEPQPAARPARRPRPSSQPVAQEADDLARTVAEVVSSDEAEAEPDEVPVPQARELRPRAVTPRPEPAAEPARATRPGLFGARRTEPASDASLPDLSSLRATPEEIAASAEAREQEEEDQSDATDPGLTTDEDDWREPEPKAPAPEPAAPVARPDRTGDRPRLFDREPRGRPAEPVPPPRDVPISRSPAPPRTPVVAAMPEPAAARPALDEAQFSPRAIMMRERRAEPDAPAPRRERPRIVAQARPAAAAPPAPESVSAGDQSLMDEAIALILTRSAELEREIDSESRVPVDLILDHTRETGELVQGLVSRGESDALRRINIDLGEVMDLIMLMQLEKGHAPADDALTLLLQLRRELETLRAA
ncbi:MAG: hypothetical protein J0L76_02695 [Rhodobacterales bacterium]|nr:hypothetical protein [Rhodobacterales bacterium]